MQHAMKNLVFAVCGLCVFTNAAWAQLDYGEIEQPVGATDEVVTQDNIPFYWLSTFEGVPCYKDAACETEIGKLSFREEFFELWRDDSIVLLAKGRSGATSYEPESVVGFVKQDDMIVSRNNVYRGTRAANGVLRKAIVVHRWDKGGQAVAAEATLRESPDENSKELGSVNLFEFLYIYSLTSDSGDGYCLVGTGPFLNVADEDLQKQRLLGWLPNRRVFFWDHREGVEFNKDQEAFRWRNSKQMPIQCYVSANESPESVPQKAEDLIPAYAEDLNKSDSWLYHMPRYPIISQKPVEIEGQKYMQLGVIGDSYEAGSNKVVAAAPLESRIRNELAEIEKNSRKLDVLFVIDATGSMQEYFGSIRKSVMQIQKELRESRDNIPIRYGVMYYRDYTEESIPDSWSQFFVDLVTESTFANKFPHVSDGGGNDNPPPLYAIDTAVQKATWDEGSMRAVILIGDMGNEQPDKRKYDVERVAKTLKEFNCEFFAIQAQPNYVSSDARLKAFNDQAEAIARAIGMPSEQAKILAANGKDVGTAISSSVQVTNNRAEILRDVLEKLQSGSGLTDAIIKALEGAGINPGAIGAGGTTSAGGTTQVEFADGGYGNRILQSLMSRFDDKDIDAEIFANKRIQHFGIAYSPIRLENSPHDSFKTKILMTHQEFQELIALIVKIQRKGVTPSNVSELWRGLVNDLTGDQESEVTFDETKPLAEYMTKILGVPVRSELLNKSVVEIKRMDPNTLAELRDTLATVYERMNNYENDMTTDGSMTEKHWFPVRHLEYGWIPLEIMP